MPVTLTEEWTVDRVLEETGRDPRNKGYTAEICGNSRCNGKANVLRRLPSWQCECGRWNLIPTERANVNLHEEPTIGPPAQLIYAANMRRARHG
ncbi:MAG: hypothetical protein AAB407_01050 [Patescibacteria group bacterium]